METNKIYQGDCLQKLKDLPNESVDSIVTDPPYELGFMGKSWDNTGIANNKEMWKECLRVLKPGAYLLSFGGTRTYHRMACAIEDAGFEIRNMIEWVYGSGFPKSLNIGKAVDKIALRLGQFDEFAKHLSERIKTSGKSQKEISILFPSKTGGLTGCVWNWANGANVPTVAQWNILKPLLDLSDEFLPLIERIEREREIIGTTITNKTVYQNIGGTNISGEIDITKGTSEWEGWGTALKPAHEPICMARKPLSEKTVAENVLKYGTGGINIDESRVALAGEWDKGTMGTFRKAYDNPDKTYDGTKGNVKFGGDKLRANRDVVEKFGRFPANLIHDNSEEVLNEFPNTENGWRPNRKNHNVKSPAFRGFSGDEKTIGVVSTTFNDSGSSSRFFKTCEFTEQDFEYSPFFYCAKASKSERNKGMDNLEAKPMYKADGSGQSLEIFGSTDGGRENRKNNHPTVKPLKLMEYLIKMVTHKGGIVLDPFAGSGTTGVACKNLNRNYILIEKEPEYVKIAEERLTKLNDGNDGIPPKPKDLGILPTII